MGQNRPKKGRLWRRKSAQMDRFSTIFDICHIYTANVENGQKSAILADFCNLRPYPTRLLQKSSGARLYRVFMRVTGGKGQKSTKWPIFTQNRFGAKNRTKSILDKDLFRKFLETNLLNAHSLGENRPLTDRFSVDGHFRTKRRENETQKFHIREILGMEIAKRDFHRRKNPPTRIFFFFFGRRSFLRANARKMKQKFFL